MEKLNKRSDGHFETASGALAVKPLTVTAKDKDYKWFQFKTAPFAQPIRIRWRIGDEIVVIPEEYARFMINMRFARDAFQEEADRWNAKVDELLARNTLAAQHKPASTQAPAAATTAPTGGETAPEAAENASNGTVAPTGATGGDTKLEEAEKASESGQETAETDTPSEGGQNQTEEAATEEAPKKPSKKKADSSTGLI